MTTPSDMANETTPVPPDDGPDHAAPDWGQITFEPPCPLCEYNLRGLNTPRCPECGYRFRWPEVLNPRREDHPYLFEHHPERNLTSFVQTAVGACRPRRFWNALNPSQRSRPRRLLLYWCLGAFCLALVSPGFIVTQAALRVNQMNARRARTMSDLKQNSRFAQFIIQQNGSVKAYLDRVFPQTTIRDELRKMMTAGTISRYYNRCVLPMVVVTPLAWAWCTFAALMIFRISMRRARVKTVHVLRCVLYSLDPWAWSVLALLGVVVIPYCFSQRDFERGVFMLLGVGIMFGSWRLWAAYKYYLRFDRPFVTMLASQIIAFLVTLVLMCAYDEFGLAYEFFRVLPGFPW